MSDKRTTLIWTLRDEVSGTAKKLNNNLDAVGVRAKSATGILGKLNTATGGLVSPTSLAASAGLAFVGVMAEATRKAIEEERNIAKLDAALKANIPGWNGNTDAIEKQITARERLAFSDDELRNSLAQIVAATHDVTKAQEIQATAMDLARLKGISLEDASQALIRVEAGQYRALKSLGIVLKAGATQTEALAAVQKVAGGQAAAFAQTTEAKLMVAQIKLDDAMENLGRVTMPMVANAASILSATFGILSGDTDALTAANEQLAGSQWASLDPVTALSNAGRNLGIQVHDNITGATELAARTAAVGKSMDDERQAAKLAAGALAALNGVTQDTSKDAADAAAHVAELTRLTRQMLYWDAKARATVPGYGNPNSGKKGSGTQGRAGGGPVLAGQTYSIGETGPETLVMSAGGNGFIIPNGGAQLMSLPSVSGVGGSTVVHTTIQLDGRTIARVVDEHNYRSLQRAAPTAGRT